jgi:Membrane protein involved in the export of O-antigen and teichoic acid
MFKKIIGTGGTRALNALFSFLTLWIGTHELGAVEWGIGYVVLLDVSLMLIAIEFFAGSGLVYFSPRKKLSTLMLISFTWISIVILIFALVFWLLSIFPSFYHRFVPEGYGGITLLLTLIYSFHNFNLNIMLGKGKIAAYNIVFFLQIFTQLITMIILIYAFHIHDASAFTYSFLAGYSMGMLVGFGILMPYIKKEGLDPIKETIKELFNYGFIIQLSTLVHLLNKRLSVFMLKSYCNERAVGIYSSGTQVSEGVKLIGHSISLVQFSTISNTKDQKQADKLTLQFLKISVILTAIVLLIMAAVPRSVYEFVFTEQFSQIKEIVMLMAPGVILLSANTVFTHYFSGIGLPKHNLIASCVGLAVTIPSVFLLTKYFGIAGSAISMTFIFGATTYYQWHVFKKMTKTKSSALLLKKDDIELFKSELKSLFKKVN